jgi:hypothetical protein
VDSSIFSSTILNQFLYETTVETFAHINHVNFNCLCTSVVESRFVQVVEE